jgi:hypothetical protein
MLNRQTTYLLSRDWELWTHWRILDLLATGLRHWLHLHALEQQSQRSLPHTMCLTKCHCADSIRRRDEPTNQRLQ